MFPVVVTPELVLPGDPFWLLRVPVKQGEAVPFKLQMLFHRQFGMRPFREQEPDYQADGFR